MRGPTGCCWAVLTPLSRKCGSHEEGWEEGQWACYQCQLDNGQVDWTPIDENGAAVDNTAPVYNCTQL
jgi:hypothetical protein